MSDSITKLISTAGSEIASLFESSSDETEKKNYKEQKTLSSKDSFIESSIPFFGQAMDKATTSLQNIFSPNLSASSPHQISNSIIDLYSLIQDPKTATIEKIIPSALSQIQNGTIEFEAFLNEGEYPFNLAVVGKTKMIGKITFKDGQLTEGLLKFEPHSNKVPAGILMHTPYFDFTRAKGRTHLKGWLGLKNMDAEVEQIKIFHDPKTKQLSFQGTALAVKWGGHSATTFPNMTPEIAQILLGIPLSEENDMTSMETTVDTLKKIVEHLAKEETKAKMAPLMGMMNLSTLRFRADINPTAEDLKKPLPALAEKSSLRVRLPELEISENLKAKSISATLTISPNQETGGFDISIPEAGIDSIEHIDSKPGQLPDFSSSQLSGLRLKDMNVLMAYNNQITYDSRNSLAGLYPQTGSGQITFGGGSLVGGDIQLGGFEEAPISFDLVGSSDWKIQTRLDIPSIGIDHIHSLGVQLLNGPEVTVDVANSMISAGLDVFVDLGGFNLNELVVRGSLYSKTDVFTANGSLPGQVSFFTNATEVELATDFYAQGKPLQDLSVDLDVVSSIPEAIVSTSHPLVEADLSVSNDLAFSGKITPTSLNLHEARNQSTVDSLNATIKVGGTRAVLKTEPKGKISADLLVTSDGKISLNSETKKLSLTAMGEKLGFSNSLSATTKLFFPDFNHLGIVTGETKLSNTALLSNKYASASVVTKLSDTRKGQLSISTDIQSTKPIDIQIGSQLTLDLSKGVVDYLQQKYYSFLDLNAYDPIAIGVSLFTKIADFPAFSMKGSGQLSKLTTNPQLDLALSSEALTVNVPANNQGISGTMTVNPVLTQLNADLKHANLSITPPKISVDLSQKVKTGQGEIVTLTYSGSLEDPTELPIGINFGTKKVALGGKNKERALAGSLTIKATDASGKVLGSGSVNVSSQYTLDGNLSADTSTLALHVSKTDLTGELTDSIDLGVTVLPKGSSFSLPSTGLSTVVTVNDIMSGSPSVKLNASTPEVKGATITIPKVSLAGGIEFNDVTVDIEKLTTLPNGSTDPLQGQQWEAFGKIGESFSFNALAGADGNLPPFQFKMKIYDKGNKNLNVVVDATTQAKEISGSFDPLGKKKMSLTLTGLEVVNVLAGKVDFNGLIDLDNVNITSHASKIGASIDPVTKELSLDIPSTEIPGFKDPPSNLSDWMAWDRSDYQEQLKNNPHLLVLPEKLLEVPGTDKMLNDLGIKIPVGSGDVIFDFDGSSLSPKDLTVSLSNAGDLKTLQSTLIKHLKIRRMSPGAPPRKAEKTTSSSVEMKILENVSAGYSNESILYKNDTTDGGTLYFISEELKDGKIQGDPDMARRLKEGLGMTEQEVGKFLTRNGQVKVVELISILKRDTLIASTFSDADLTSFVLDSLQSHKNSTAEKNSHRTLITLGNIRKQLPKLLKGSTEAHQFSDESFHKKPSAGNPDDGIDMQFMSILPLSSKEVEQTLARSSAEWDPWVKKKDGEELLLGKFKKEDMIANSKTHRLLPLTLNGKPATLLIMNIHENFKGDDEQLPLPDLATIAPTKISFKGKEARTKAIQMLGGAFLEGVAKATPPPLTIFYADRFAVMTDNIIKATTGKKTAATHVADLDISKTFPIIDFLSVDLADAANPVLSIKEGTPEYAVKPFFERLNIDAAVSAKWIADKKIPIKDLAEAAKVQCPTSLVQGVAMFYLNPTKEFKDTTDHMTSPTERFFIFVEDSQHFDELKKPKNGSYPVRTRVFFDERFHQLDSAADVADTTHYYIIPKSLGLTKEQIITQLLQAEDFAKLSGNFVKSTKKLDPSNIPNADPNRVYVDTGIVALGLELFYRLSTFKDLVPLGETVLTAWRFEVNPDKGKNNFSTNIGAWLGDEDDEFIYVPRFGILETIGTNDRSPSVAKTAISLTSEFMGPVLAYLLKEQGKISYFMQSAIDEDNKNVF